MIVKIETVGPFQENCYIIGDEKTKIGAIIDPGDEAERLIKSAKKTGLAFKYILNTHAHLDHVCAVQAVKDEFKIPFYLHRLELPLLERLPQQAAMFGLQVSGAPTVDVFYDMNSTIEIGDLKASLVHAPGHSPGSVVFYFASESIAIGGDVLFQGSIGRTDLPGGDFDTLIDSIREKLFTLPDETIIYPGHGPATKIGFEKRHNPFLDIAKL